MRNDIFHYICQNDALPAEELYHTVNGTPPGTSWQQLGDEQPATTATAAACDSFGVSAQ